MENPTPDPTEGIDTPSPTEGAAPVEAETTTIEPAPDASPAPEADTPAETESAEEPKEKAPAPRTERRIQQLVSDKKAAMEYGDFWKQKYEAELGGQNAPEPAPEPLPLTPPKLEDYDYDQDAWSAAMLSHATAIANEAAASKLEEALQRQAQEASTLQRQQSWAEKEAVFAAEHPDYVEVAFATKEMFEAIQELDLGPEASYALGQLSEAELTRIQGLSPMRMGVEISSLVASQPAPSKPAAAPKPTTQAPEPMAPLAGGSQPSISPANETMEDFVKRRWEETKAQRGL